MVYRARNGISILASVFKFGLALKGGFRLNKNRKENIAVQNLKVDIIYHQSPSDFEMEFNLGSSCHMRLLSDKTTDKKGFIKALVRDVARSRVIICCGPLFKDDGLINMVAKAIGAGITQCDNKTYGINSSDSIYIINGSTPLVTPDGYFGGCIIESGPQTIMLLTENKTFRKAIMKNLIHPYMSEISYIMPNAEVESTPDSTESVEYETAISENEIYLTQKDDGYETDEQEQDLLPSDVDNSESNMDFVMDGEIDDQADTQEEAVEDDMYINLYTIPATDEEKDSGSETPYTPSESDNMFLSERIEDEFEQSNKRKNAKRSMDITIVALVLLILLAVLALVYLVVLRPLTMGIGVGEYINEIFGLANSNTLV